MKFGEKYELLESVTTGAVETFVANDKIRGHRVLVHILHCDPQKPNQPTVQWVLETFRKFAPEPAGLVLEAGKYSGTLYAYLVTKVPEQAALRAWVQQYKTQNLDTQEVPVSSRTPTRESEAPTAEVAPKEPPKVPVGFTQVFREFGSQPTSPGPPTPRPADQTAQPPNLCAAGEWTGLHPAPPRDTGASIPPKQEPSVTDALRSGPPAQDLRAEPIAPAKDSGLRPGEFTSFFQGPFRADGPSQSPVVSSSELEPPRKAVGEFTAMFGAVTSPSQEPPPTPAAGKDAARSGFSGGWLSDSDIPSRTSPPPTPPAPAVGPPRPAAPSASAPPTPPQQPFIPPPPVVQIPPTPPLPPLPAPPVVTKPPIPPTPLPSTPLPSVPSPVVSEPTLGPPPAGPSPYTQIISVKPPAATAEPAAAEKSATVKLPGFAAPPKPAAPAIPKVTPPALKTPKVEPPKPPVSYWPLVLVLTVLFFIAVLLVLYFVLKH